jgi:hypothetical protein
LAHCRHSSGHRRDPDGPHVGRVDHRVIAAEGYQLQM